MAQSTGAGVLRNEEYPFIAIGVVAFDKSKQWVK